MVYYRQLLITDPSSVQQLEQLISAGGVEWNRHPGQMAQKLGKDRCNGKSGFTILHLAPLQLYLHFLLYIVKDKSLRVDEVVGGVEGHGVQWAPVNATSIHCPATGLGPDQPLDGRDKTLGREMPTPWMCPGPDWIRRHLLQECKILFVVSTCTFSHCHTPDKQLHAESAVSIRDMAEVILLSLLYIPCDFDYIKI